MWRFNTKDSMGQQKVLYYFLLHILVSIWRCNSLGSWAYNCQVCFHWEAEQNVVGCHQECVKRTNCFVHSNTRKVSFYSFHLVICGLGCKKLKVYESPKVNHSKTNTIESLHYKYMLILKMSTALVLEVIDRRLGRTEAKDNRLISPCFHRIMNGPPHHPHGLRFGLLYNLQSKG